MSHFYVNLHQKCINLKKTTVTWHRLIPIFFQTIQHFFSKLSNEQSFLALKRINNEAAALTEVWSGPGSAACGVKLFIRLVVLLFQLWYIYLMATGERESERRRWWQCLWRTSRTEGRGPPTTFLAPLSFLSRTFLSDILQLEFHVEIRMSESSQPQLCGTSSSSDTRLIFPCSYPAD